jgi:hypothetical protein
VTAPAAEPWEKLRFLAIALSIALIALAASLPSAHFIDEHAAEVQWRGQAFLFCGCMGPFFNQVGWYGNPMLVLGYMLLALRVYGVAAVSSALGLLVALTSVWLIGSELPQNEGGVNNITLRAFLPGFYVWLVGYAPVIIGGLFGMWRARAAARHAPEHR